MKSQFCKWLLVFSIFFMSYSAYAQTVRTKIINENKEFRTKMNKEFADTAETPLTKAGLAKFKKIDFFSVRIKYCVKAKLTVTPSEEPFEMPRSKGNTGTYRKFGTATFTLNGKSCKVSVYQFMKIVNDEKYKNYLFLPFNDLTNGKQTYAGGRFLDLEIPAGDTLLIDFNKAYNPLCCYGNPKYSCPIPPKENLLEVKILAGEKKYKGE